jgi:hypothetical protein
MINTSKHHDWQSHVEPYEGCAKDSMLVELESAGGLEHSRVRRDRPGHRCPEGMTCGVNRVLELSRI